MSDFMAKNAPIRFSDGTIELRTCECDDSFAVTWRPLAYVSEKNTSRSLSVQTGEKADDDRSRNDCDMEISFVAEFVSLSIECKIAPDL